MKPTLIWLFLFIAIPLFGNGFSDRVDKSEDAFFPAEFGTKLRRYKSFPALWWNFVILEGKTEVGLFAESHLLCQKLKSEAQMAQVECEQDPAQYLGLIEDWARDETVRKPFPQNWKQKVNEALAKASLPIPKGIFNVLRSDPFGTVDELKELSLKRLRLELERVQGFFYDRNTLRIVIPVKLNFPPSESDNLADFPERLSQWCRGQENCTGVGLIGPHGSTLENKSRIAEDLGRVSLVGVLVFLSAILFFFVTKQQRLLWLFAPIGVGTLMGTLITVLYFGKIHGLTLSFGTGIIGLTIDYGLQAAFNQKSPYVWRSNFFGFLTTLICLIVLYFTQIPLLKQIIWFSIWGFAFGYGLLYYFRDRLFSRISVQPWPIAFKTNRGVKLLVLLLLSGAFFALKLQPRLDLRQFDYQSHFTRQMTDWVFQKTFRVPPLFEIQDESETPVAAGRVAHEWAIANRIGIESLNNYLPPEDIQSQNAASWKDLQCGPSALSTRLESNSKKIFEPYLDRIQCHHFSQLPLKGKVPHYLQHLHSKGSWLRLWFPADSQQAKIIQGVYPAAISLGELVAIFPRILAKEMRVMLPVSLALVLVILYFYYRRLRLALLGLLPFATGLGLCLWAAQVFHLPLSFMSLIGLVMVLGFSVDYAVFVIDAMIYHEGETQIHGRATGLIYAAASTILGFLPLVFCGHPVLSHLGNFLVLGVLGTLVGTFWGIPAFFRRA